MRYCSALIAMLVSILFAHADERSEALDRQSVELYQQVFSPFCPGRSLQDCPSSKAHELKAQMRLRLEQGAPPEEVLKEVFARFGDQYRAVPAYEGFGKLVWWIPLGFLLTGLCTALVVGLGRKKSSTVVSASQEGAPASSVISEEIKARIEKELSQFD